MKQYKLRAVAKVQAVKITEEFILDIALGRMPAPFGFDLMKVTLTRRPGQTEWFLGEFLGGVADPGDKVQFAALGDFLIIPVPSVRPVAESKVILVKASIFLERYEEDDD